MRISRKATRSVSERADVSGQTAACYARGINNMYLVLEEMCESDVVPPSESRVEVITRRPIDWTYHSNLQKPIMYKDYPEAAPLSKVDCMLSTFSSSLLLSALSIATGSCVVPWSPRSAPDSVKSSCSGPAPESALPSSLPCSLAAEAVLYVS